MEVVFMALILMFTINTKLTLAKIADAVNKLIQDQGKCPHCGRELKR